MEVYPEKFFQASGCCKQPFFFMIIKIDTDIWVTPVRYAALKEVSIQVVQNWMARKKVEVWFIEELNLKLIRLNR